MQSVNVKFELFTLRESPPAHPKTATLAKSTDYRALSVFFSATMPRGVALIREAWEHTEKRRTGDAAISQEGRMEEESEEEVGEGEEGGGGGGGGRGGEDEQKGQRPLGCLSESLGMSFGSLLEASWGVLGASWRSQGLLGASWMPRGSVLGPLGGLLGASWGPLGGLLGPPGRLLGPSWRPSIKKEGGSFFRPPVGAFKWASWGALGALLGPSWGALGRSWGPLGPLLGSSWGLLGPSWSHLEASEAHPKRKGERPKNIDFL